MAHRYHRFIIIADPRLGFTSFSWRVKEALEQQGHCVFWFEPHRWPQLFEDRVCKLECLDALIARWSVDAVLVADGLGVDASRSQAKVPVLGLVAENTADAEGSFARTTGARFDVALCFGDAARAAVETRRAQAQGVRVPDASTLRVCSVNGFWDEPLFEVQLANELVCVPGLVCFDGKTHSAVREALSARRADIPVYCLDHTMPQGFDTSHNGSLYALRNAVAVVEGDGGDAGVALTEYQRFIANGFAAPVCRASDAARFAPATGSSAGPVTPAAASVRKGIPASVQQFEPLSKQLASFFDPIFSQKGIAGHDDPAGFVCALGYFGCGNFGDEFILSTIAKRMESRCGNLITVAVGENPWHTLVNRGIFAITLQEKFALNAILKKSSASLVCAGLLFDQGIRWTMGQTELLSSVSHTDIPGITAFVELGYLNGVTTSFYGIGAGPLANPDSQRLLSLCGALGSVFYARDAHTAQLISACGVPAEQVFVRADAAFTSERVGMERASQWLEEQGYIANTAKDADYIAVSLRNYENVDGSFASRIASALDVVAESHDTVRFVFCILDQDDETISKRVIELMHSADRCIMFNPNDDLDLMASMLELVRCGLSMRYHCSLLINRAGHPCVGLGYLPKVEALYREVGCGERLLLGMDASTGDIAGALESTLAEYDEYAGLIRAGVEKLASLAMNSEDDLVRAIVQAGEQLIASDPHAAHEPVFFTYESDVDRRLRYAYEERGRAEAHAREVEGWLEQARKRIRELEESNSYRIGSALMKVPGWIKHRLRRG